MKRIGCYDIFLYLSVSLSLCLSLCLSLSVSLHLILEMIISRNVISSILTGSMKLLSSQFRERAVSDKLYQIPLFNYKLKLLIRTTHSDVSLEKNEVITISPYQMNNQAENLFVKIVKILFFLYCKQMVSLTKETFFSQSNQRLAYFQQK